LVGNAYIAPIDAPFLQTNPSPQLPAAAELMLETPRSPQYLLFSQGMHDEEAPYEVFG
jgi:hypothetical protein